MIGVRPDLYWEEFHKLIELLESDTDKDKTKKKILCFSTTQITTGL